MTEWMKQAEDMFKAWSQAQKKMIENLAESVKVMGVPQGAELWEKTLTTWEAALEKSSAAQAEWTQKWLESFKSMQGMPEPALQATQQFEEMTRRWNATQEQLWAKWFQMLRGLDPAKLTGKWSDAFQNPFQIWQDATKKVIDAQMEWMRSWSGVGGKPADKSGGE